MTEVLGRQIIYDTSRWKRRLRQLGSALLIVALEVFVVLVAGKWGCVGAAALVAFAFGQVVAAMRVASGTGKPRLVMSTVSLAAALVIAATTYFHKTVAYDSTAETVSHAGPLGWTLRPGVVRVIKAINGQTVYERTYTIDSDGLRDTKSATDGPAIAFFGDSFTLGEGVADSEAMPQAFADQTGRKFRVVNAGVYGYSPAQVLRELELGLYDKRVMPAKAFFMLTVNWQAARVACAHDSLIGSPRYESNGGTVRFAGTCGPVPPPATLGSRLLMATPLGKALFAGGLRHVTDAEIQSYIDVMVAIGHLAKTKYGVPLHVLYLRNPSYLIFNHFSDDTIMETFRKAGLIVYDLTLPQEGRGAFAIPMDGHPTGLAHRLHVEALVAALKRDEPELLASGPQPR